MQSLMTDSERAMGFFNLVHNTLSLTWTLSRDNGITLQTGTDSTKPCLLGGALCSDQ